MPVTSVTTNPDTHSIDVVAEFPAPVERIWELWTKPRELERWFGPPGYPLTVVDHDLRPGGRVTYFMTGPEGEKFHGYWDVDEVTPTSRLAFRDGFGDKDGNPTDAMPVATTVHEFQTTDTGTKVVSHTTYASAEDLQQVLDMGMQEGLTAAVGQIDDILASEAA